MPNSKIHQYDEYDKIKCWIYSSWHNHKRNLNLIYTKFISRSFLAVGKYYWDCWKSSKDLVSVGNFPRFRTVFNKFEFCFLWIFFLFEFVFILWVFDSRVTNCSDNQETQKQIEFDICTKVWTVGVSNDWSRRFPQTEVAVSGLFFPRKEYSAQSWNWKKSCNIICSLLQIIK